MATRAKTRCSTRAKRSAAGPVARALATTADSVVTIDPHKEHILDFFFDGAHSVSAVPQLAEELGRWGVDCILAPDKGARDRAEGAARQLGVAFDHLEKTRLSATDVRMEAKDMDVAGKRVAIVDDMIASGGTMITAAKQLKKQGAKAVYAACTHGLFTGGAVPKLLAGGIDRVLCTDTVDASGCDVISAAPAVAAPARQDLRTMPGPASAMKQWMTACAAFGVARRGLRGRRQPRRRCDP